MVPHPLNNPEYLVVVQLIKEIRLEAGLSQEELAQKLGVDQSLVSKVERRERRLDIAELRRICEILGMNLIEFVERYEIELNKRANS